MAKSSLELPHLVGTQDPARSLWGSVPAGLSTSELSIDCSKVQASAPSFVDELIKIALVERAAARLTLTAAPTKMRDYAVRSAANRGVSARLTIID